MMNSDPSRRHTQSDRSNTFGSNMVKKTFSDGNLTRGVAEDAVPLQKKLFQGLIDKEGGGEEGMKRISSTAHLTMSEYLEGIDDGGGDDEPGLFF